MGVVGCGTGIAYGPVMPNDDQDDHMTRKKYLVYQEILIREAVVKMNPLTSSYLTQNSLRLPCTKPTNYSYTRSTLSHSKDKIK